jgi:hypothetical protein
MSKIPIYAECIKQNNVFFDENYVLNNNLQ